MPYIQSRLSLGQVESIWRSAADVSEENRASNGKWTNGPGSTSNPHTEITADEARGNSRSVSAKEFQDLAAQGKDQLDKIMADTRPTSALDDNKQWSSIKGSAYKAVQKSWGGQTIDPQTGHAVEPNSGYALQVRKPGETQVSVPEDASEDEFNEAMDKAKAKYPDQLAGSQVYLGVFKDDDEGRIDIDPVALVHSTDEVESLGSYTRAIGGAYDFSSGDGYFPPHVQARKAARYFPPHVRNRHALHSA